jgi:hypothetical protein
MAWYSMQPTEKKSLMEGAEAEVVVETQAEKVEAPVAPSEAPVEIPGANEQIEEAGGDVPKIPE